ncbi:MAG TPA: ABC transporter permease subunit [Cyclobacteriaceae bacterium]|nr:ABC transporter permease [Cyclobacteriaceae bacterium]HMV11072.1 ABC transporter permease subunit [Cyclobacteriaceae bacterium]HMV88927.1 ABC transporter permease subunit [Cyclobacteriaceae bacterium]HMX01112.1 ABC transporter permease subunit [Cyclobacteriaceae bacterium]HMX51928.1 ABC transporter permease subunit [Cyclobacteriaceae bacterium]
MTRVLKYILYDILRTRFILLYTAFLFISTFGLYQLDSDAGKVVLSLLNIVLMVVPLVSIVFSTIHFFNSYEFIELMLAQPVKRSTVFLGEYMGVACSLCAAFVTGVGVPMLLFGINANALTMLYTGVTLTLVFVSLAFLSSVLTRDKAKAIGIALLFWLYFSLIYDGLLLWVVYSFSDYPLEKITLVLIAFNPVDLARIIMLLQLDISALMGFTGAFYQEFFGSYLGMVLSTLVLFIWIVLPIALAQRIFNRKDL